MNSYFDNDITEKNCKELDFSNWFYSTAIKSSRKPIITVATLIEHVGLGERIKDCLSDRSEYNIDTSSSLINQMHKAHKHYKKAVRKNIIDYLKKALQNKHEYIKTKTPEEKNIYTDYSKYLDNSDLLGEIAFYIAVDRVSALRLENATYHNANLDIASIVLKFIKTNPSFPFVRLIFTCLKKNPSNIKFIVELIKQKIEGANLISHAELKNIASIIKRRVDLKQKAEDADFSSSADLIDIESTIKLMADLKEKIEDTGLISSSDLVHIESIIKCRIDLKKKVESADLISSADLVDIELIQFSLIGYSGYPLHFYTMDSLKIIKKRIMACYIFLKNILYSETKNPFIFGTISIIHECKNKHIRDIKEYSVEELCESIKSR